MRRRRTPRARALRWWLASALAATACTEPPEPADPPPPADRPAAAASEPARDEAADRLGLQAQCLSRSRGPIALSLRRWADAVGDDGRPRRKGTLVRIDDLAAELVPCREARRLDTAATEDPVRDAMVTYVDATEDVVELAGRLHPYYRDETFADDDWALSSELAPKLVEARTRWTAAARAFETTLRVRLDAADVAALARAKAAGDPASVELHARETFELAKALERCADPGASESQPEPPTATDCADALAALQRSADDFARTWARQGSDDAVVFWGDAFDASLARYVEAATAAIAPSTKKRKPADDAALTDRRREAWTILERDFRRLDFAFPT